MVVDAVVQRALGRQVGVVREGRAEVLAVVVVAGNHEAGNGQLRQQSARLRVFVGPAFVDEVAGQQHELGPAVKGVQMVDGFLEHPVRIGHALVELAGGADVRVGDLGNEHHRALREVRPAASRFRSSAQMPVNSATSSSGARAVTSASSGLLLSA